MDSCDIYDPSEVRLIVAGIDITGYADGSKIKLEPVTKELYGTKKGADGHVTYSKKIDPRYMVTVNLKQDSTSNAYLSGLMRAPACFPVTISNTGGGKFIGGGTKCRIMERPSYEWAEEDTNREWKIMIPDFSGGDLPA